MSRLDAADGVALAVLGLIVLVNVAWVGALIYLVLKLASHL